MLLKMDQMQGLRSIYHFFATNLEIPDSIYHMT